MRRILLFIILFVSVSSFAQEDYQAQQRKLEARKNAILKEIREFQTLLTTNKKQERDILSELNVQNQKIKLQQELIANSQKQYRNLANDIYVNTLAANKLRRELKVLKADYGKTVRTSYKSRSDQSKVLFILSSENFLQAYKRVQYLKQYANFRKTQGDELQEKTIELEQINVNLEIQKGKQQKIIQEQEQEKKALEGDRKKQNELMAIVKKDSKKYSDQIRKKQQENQKIEREIQAIVRKMIEEENRKRREEEARKAKASGKAPSTKPVSSTRLEMTPAEKALAASFTNNRGRLPWPVERGYISTKYGTIRHPEHANVSYESHGIEITSERGIPVRSVFEGTVSEIQVIGNSKAVLIRHGEYITVYQNLATVSVTSGQKVSTKQQIGTVGVNFEGKAVIKFMVMKNTEFNNPQTWLSSK
ncbi:MAG TPA: peptidoglycan DD-metalloendopeptidase family protein [Flavobacterium sp.]|nr:peptidoglycan DD-metalloendopeptidase family protein [Flavobacterium sp.]